MQGNKNHGLSDYSTLIWSIIIGAVCFLTHIFISAGTEADAAITGLIILVVYLITVSCLSVYIYYAHRKEKHRGADKLKRKHSA